jgi:hypothetical protein
MRLPFKKREVPFGLDQDWESFADRRIHYLKRGRDYEVESSVLSRVFKEKARELNRVSRIVAEEIPRMGYWDSSLYVQFFDAELTPGAPCPCGSLELVRNHPQSARCPKCGRILIILELPPEDLMGPAPDDPATAAAARSIAASGIKLMRRKDDERFTLREYSQVRWISDRREGKSHRHFGTAVDPFGFPVLMYVDSPRSGDPLKLPAHLLQVCRWPCSAFADLIDIDAVEQGRNGAHSHEAAAPRPPTPAPDGAALANHRQLDAFTAVRFRAREELPSRERYFGTALEATGNPVLIWVDYPLVDGKRVSLSDDGTATAHRVYRWPGSDFPGFVDLEPLLARP